MNAELISLGLPLLSADLPFIRIVDFVADKENRQVLASNLASLIYPALHVLKAWPARDVVADHGHRAIVDVTGDETPKALLAGSIPKLQPHHFVLMVDSLCQEVDSNRCLSCQRESNLPGT